MTSIRAVRTEEFTQYDGTNSAAIFNLFETGIPAGWDVNYSHITSETGGVLTMDANYADISEPGNYAYFLHVVMNETDWAQHGHGITVVTDADIQANYIIKE
jgi:hypothetical protein